VRLADVVTADLYEDALGETRRLASELAVSHSALRELRVVAAAAQQLLSREREVRLLTGGVQGRRHPCRVWQPLVCMLAGPLYMHPLCSVAPAAERH
jgi:hypothetical protein